MISNSYYASDHSTGHSFSTPLGVTAEAIYEFFLHGVQTSSPEAVLDTFEQLFFYLLCPSEPKVQRALETILSVETGESCFHSTIQRCCYILINNWLLIRRNSREQKEVARHLSKQLKDQYKFQ